MNLSEDFKAVLNAVTNKRARFVIDTILEKGFCSTEDLKNGGYEHAPRAARDVRELGIPLETFKIKDSMGKNIAAYRFGDWEEAKKVNPLAKTSGRTQLTEKLKSALLDKYGAKCNLYGEEYSARLLQPDHRVPYEIGGDPKNMMDLESFMLLSPSANRDKSWACEHCVNWIDKNVDMCKKCYYAYPENYEHIAGKKEKRLNIIFRDKDMQLYENLVKQAESHGISYEDEAKRIISYYEKINQYKRRKTGVKEVLYMYSESELVAIARRENNSKRNYLVINRFQGKHIPVAPSKALKMFYELGGLVKKAYAEERLLIIGFAETATAIGAALAVCTDSLYMQTTRENVEGATYLYFTESHSHATEQKLVRESLESVLDKIDRIVFAEDEITTGNTILKIVNIIKEEFHVTLPFSAVSILNSMDKEAETIYKEQNISCHYLLKTNHDIYPLLAKRCKTDGTYVELIKDLEGEEWNANIFAELETDGYQNARCITKGADYQNACEKLWQQVKTEFFRTCSKTEQNSEIPVSINIEEHDEISNSEKDRRILVLGTEEFMYPALYAAARIEEMGYHVKFHATTRSPITVSDSYAYPLHEKFELRSLYDKDRVTYIYELDKYDKVFIITDAKKGQTEGISSLVNALKSRRNTNISIIRWCRA